MWKEKLEEEAFVVFPKSTEINIQFNPKSCGFTKIISYLHSLVDVCDPDVTVEMNLNHPELLWYEIREEYLRLRIEKVFWVREFIPSKISNQRKATIKKYFIQVIELLQNYHLIEDNYKYMSQGKIYKTSKLDLKNISEGFILYEKLNL